MPTPASTRGCARSAGSSTSLGDRRRRTSSRRGSPTRSRRSSSGAASRASGATARARCCASCRWPWRTWLPSRSRPMRCEPRSRGGESASGPWGPGRQARRQCCSPTAPGNDGGAAGETVFAKGGPGALAKALAAAARHAGAVVETGVEVVRITSRDGRATGVVLADGEEIAAARRRLGRRPEANGR